MSMLANLFGTTKPVVTDVEYWHTPERAGWLMKQGEYFKNWRRRWFVLKGGKIFWFLSDIVTPDSVPRGVIEVNTTGLQKRLEKAEDNLHLVKKCLSIKGAEDIINKPHSFEISTTMDNMFFIADTEKEKEDWINAVGRAIVRHSRSLMENDQADYTN